MTSTVSIILPAYKRRYLREAIQSILAQSYRDFELVVVDDASPENLKEVVDAFDDPRLAYHRNETNLGGKSLVAAWTHAMGFARGDWCVLASDDDLYAPRFLEEMLRLAAKYPETNVFHSRVRVIDGEGREMRLSELRNEWESAVDMTYNRAIRRCQQTMPDFMFRRSALEALGGFVDFPVAWYTDDATWMAMAKTGGVGYSSEVLFSFRNSGVSISTTARKWAREKMEAGYAFSRWVVRFAQGLIPRSAAERKRLQEIMVGVDDQVIQMAVWETNSTSYLKTVRMLWPIGIPLVWKMKILSRRLSMAMVTRLERHGLRRGRTK